MWSWTWNFIIALRTLNEFAYNVVSSRMPYGIIVFQLTIKENGQQWSMASTLWGTFGGSMKTSLWLTLNPKFILWHCWPLKGPNENGRILKLINWRHETVFVHRRHRMDQVADLWFMPWSWPWVWIESNKRKSWLSQWSCIKRHLKENGLTTRPPKFCTTVVV